MTREDIIKNPGYWTAKAQLDLYSCAEDFMKSRNMNRTQLAEYLGVTKGYVSQLLSGDYDHKLSKFVELALAFGVVPKIEFQPIEEAINDDRRKYTKPVWHPVTYTDFCKANTKKFRDTGIYETVTTDSNTFAA